MPHAGLPSFLAAVLLPHSAAVLTVALTSLSLLTFPPLRSPFPPPLPLTPSNLAMCALPDVTVAVTIESVRVVWEGAIFKPPNEAANERERMDGL